MLNPRSLRFDTRQIDYTHHHHDYDYTLPKSTLISLIIGVGTFAVTSILVFFSLRIYLRRRSLRRAQAMSGSGEDLREIMREYLDEGVKGNEGTKPEMWEVEMKYEDEITQVSRMLLSFPRFDLGYWALSNTDHTCLSHSHFANRLLLVRTSLNLIFRKRYPFLSLSLLLIPLALTTSQRSYLAQRFSINRHCRPQSPAFRRTKRLFQEIHQRRGVM